MRKTYNIRDVRSDFAVAIRRHNKVNKTRLIKFFAIIFFIFIVIILISGIFSARLYAFADDGAELSESITSIIDGLDLSEIEEYLEKYGNEYIFSFGDSAREIVEFFVSGDLGLNYGDYIGKILSVFFKGVISLIPAFAQIVAISILCAICTGVEGGIISKTTAKTIRLAGLSLIILILASMLLSIISSATQSIARIQKQVEIITPILITLTVLTGGSASGAIYQPSALFLSTGAIEIVTGLIFPATIAVVLLTFMSKLNPEISFTGVSSLVKSIMKWVIGLTVAIFGLFITVQGSASSLFNGIFFKVTKYLVGNSVPIVGNFLSAGVDMVVMAGSLVRSSVGVLGIILLLSEIIQPVLLLAAFSVMLKICAAIVQPLGEKVSFSLFSELSKDIEFFIAGILMVAFMYLLVVMLIINSAGSFI